MISTQSASAPQLPTRRQLRRRAKALGWSQNELARRAGKDTGYVSRVLRGQWKSPGVYRVLVATVEAEERRRTGESRKR